MAMDTVISAMEKQIVGLDSGPPRTCSGCRAVKHTFDSKELETENEVLVFFAGDLAAGLVEPPSLRSVDSSDAARSLGESKSTWQNAVVECLAPYPVDIVDPRVFGDADSYSESAIASSSFWQSETLDGVEHRRYLWENDHQSNADIVVASMMLDGTESPFVMEQCFFKLGYYTSPTRVVLYCPKECAGRERVSRLCTMFGIMVASSVEELATCVRRKVFLEFVSRWSLSLCDKAQGDQSPDSELSLAELQLLEKCRFCLVKLVARQTLQRCIQEAVGEHV